MKLDLGAVNREDLTGAACSSMHEAKLLTHSLLLKAETSPARLLPSQHDSALHLLLSADEALVEAVSVSLLF